MKRGVDRSYLGDVNTEQIRVEPPRRGFSPVNSGCKSVIARLKHGNVSRFGLQGPI